MNKKADYARRLAEELLVVIKKYNDYSDEQIEELRTHLMAMFFDGTDWQKEQMLKEAYVESQIVEDGRIELGGNPLPCLNPIILLPYPQFEPGDKVRIIVLKAEE